MARLSVCVACGSELQADAKFCNFCGTPLTMVNERNSTQQAQRLAPASCTICAAELSLLNRSPRRDVCLKCFANESVWKKIKPPPDWALQQIKDTLEEDESVAAAVSGWHSYQAPAGLQKFVSWVPFLVWTGYFIATTKRIIFYIKKPTLDEVRSYPLSAITSIRITTGWVHKGFGPGADHGISFVSGDKQVDLMGCAADDYDEAAKFVDFVHANLGKTSEAPARQVSQTNAATSVNVLEELQTLADLRDKGILTDDEFQAKKQILLEKIV